MAIPVIVHLVGEDAFIGDIDALPSPVDRYVFLRNIRKRDGKELTYVTTGATAFLFPWHRISFLETMTEVQAVTTATTSVNGVAPQPTQILGFFRDDDAQN